MAIDHPAAQTSATAPREAIVAPVPTRWTVFMRTFLPWQLVRFAVINLKMFRLIWRSH